MRAHRLEQRVAVVESLGCLPVNTVYVWQEIVSAVYALGTDTVEEGVALLRNTGMSAGEGPVVA